MNYKCFFLVVVLCVFYGCSKQSWLPTATQAVIVTDESWSIPIGVSVTTK